MAKKGRGGPEKQFYCVWPNQKSILGLFLTKYTHGLFRPFQIWDLSIPERALSKLSENRLIWTIRTLVTEPTLVRGPILFHTASVAWVNRSPLNNYALYTILTHVDVKY